MKEKGLLLSLIFTVLVFLVSTMSPALSADSDWWDKYGTPKYGGKIVIHSDNLSGVYFDTTQSHGHYQLWHENLFSYSWTVNRDEWAFQLMFTPPEFMTGNVAESWEQPNLQTLVVHLQKGVRFQNIPPLNGRKLTAEDIVYHYERMIKLGREGAWFMYANYIDKVTAQDESTVLFKFKRPTALNLVTMMDPAGFNMVEAPEISKQHGNLLDWRNAVGTGPWILTDYKDGASLHYRKNPDYWGYDERHPGNKLPYADEVVFLCIPDMATSLAAIRTGKIDIMQSVPWQHAKNVAKTNPEFLQYTHPSAGHGVVLRNDRKPFTDIRVRKALQMSIDRKTIAQAVFGGNVEGTPCGLINPAMGKYAFLYKDWPQELKDEYSYNPERARKLLAEAGYPKGFKTDIVAPTIADKQILEIVKAQFRDVGVNMDINIMDPTACRTYTNAGKHDQMALNLGQTGLVFPPWVGLGFESSLMPNPAFAKDTVYDDIVKSLHGAQRIEDLPIISVKGDRYAIEHHWTVRIFPTMTYVIQRPQLKGYTGERLNWLQTRFIARMWIEQ